MKRKHPGKKYKQGSDTDNGVYMALGGGNWVNSHTHELSKLNRKRDK